MQTQSNPLAAEWRRPVWITLLVAASVAFTLGFACATPFAAFAAIAALTMSRRDALLLVGLTWFANQVVGFGALHYPLTLDCFGWGIGLGIIALLATLGAERIAKQFSHLRYLATAMAFLAAFAAYEGLLFLTSIIVQSGVEDYTVAIVTRIFAINTVAFIGLLALNKLGISAGLALEPKRQLVAMGRRG
ncbi:MAG TPA: hypothetical protein VME69_00840 [Methylocella sp.]|nr:hypothetical protein [Methylocella sp.]